MQQSLRRSCGGLETMFTIFAGSVMAFCKAVTAVSFNGTADPSGTLVVPKTVISSNMRFVFTVGVEGTGHHLFGDVLDHLFKSNKILVRLSDEKHDVVGDLYSVNYSMGQNAQHYSTALSSARENMRTLARRGLTLPFPGTVVYTSGRHRFHSYPGGTGPDKALRYFDLRLLAEVAEKEGVDLRIVYLRRPVKDIIMANTVRRDFQMHLHNEEPSTPEQKYMEYMQVLFTDIAVLQSLLAELGSGFVVCHDFDRLGNVDQSAEISDFLAPNAELSAMLYTSFISVAGAPRAPSNESLPYEGADVVAARLQRKFDTFESQVCSDVREE